MSEEQKPAPLPTWPFVEVKWEDSSTNEGTWNYHDELIDSIDITTRGWIVKETKRSLTLAGSYYWDGEEWVFGEKVTISRKAITEQKTLSCW